MDFSPLLNLKETFHTVRFTNGTSRSRSSSSITFRSWKCAKPTSADTRTRQDRNMKSDQNDVGNQKTLASSSSKEKSVGATSGLASIFNKLHLKKKKFLLSEFLLSDSFDASSWPTTSESCSAWVRPEAWKLRKLGTAHRAQQDFLRTSRKSSAPGIRRLVDTLPVKVSKSRKSY